MRNQYTLRRGLHLPQPAKLQSFARQSRQPQPVLELLQRQLRPLQGVDAFALELDVRPWDAGAFHDARHTFVPLGSEEEGADGLEAVPLPEASDPEGLSGECVPLGRLEYDLAWLLQDEDGEPVVRAPFLGVRRKPGEKLLSVGRQPRQWHRRRRGRDGDVDGQEVALGSKAVLLHVGYIRVHDGDGDQALALVEDPHVQLRRHLAHAGLDKGSRLHVVPLEGESNLRRRVQVGEDVGNDGHLGQALHHHGSSVRPPFAICEISVDGPVHVS